MGPQEFQTSFIPKKPVAPEPVEKKKTISLFSLLATVLLVASIAAAAGSYFYHGYLAQRVRDMSVQLVRAREAFEPGLIAELETLDRRMSASRNLLSSHVTISPLFATLHELTLRSVRYNHFNYTLTDAPVQQFVVTMSGEAESYRDIALQADALAGNKYIKDAVFSNLKLSEKGTVFFDLTFVVDPSFLLYQENLARSAAN